MPIRYMDPCSINTYKSQHYNLTGTNNTNNAPGYRGENGYYNVVSVTHFMQQGLSNLIGLPAATTGQWRSYGYAVRLDGEPSGGGSYLPGWVDNTAYNDMSSAAIDFGLYRNGIGNLSLRYSATASVDLGYFFPIDTWVWVSVCCQWSTTAQWAVSLDGTLIADHTMHGTANPTGEPWTYFRPTTAFIGPMSIDDIVLGDDSAPYPPLKVKTLLPASTPTGQWVGSDGNSTDNHLLVNTTDDDATYVGASASGATDLYATSGGLTAAPASVQGLYRCAYAGATGPGMKVLLSSSGTEVVEDIVPSASFAWYKGSVQANDPSTAAPWTAAGANAARVGVRIP